MMKNNFLRWTIAAIVLVIIPSQFVILTRNLKFSQSMIITVFLISLLALILILLLTASCFINPIPKLIVMILATAYYAAVYFNIGYWMYIGHQLHMSLFSDFTLRDMVVTTIGIADLRMLIYSGVFLIICFTIFVLLREFSHYFELYEKKRLALTSYFLCAILLGLLLLAIPSGVTGYIAYPLRETPETYFPDNSIYTTDSSENIFILQLESGNALALNGRLAVDGKPYDDIYYPEMYKIAQEDGILFPYFFANSPQTNRIQANMLCGIANNVVAGYSFFPDQINTTCMPEILHDAGYTTIFFRSSSLEFANTGNFLKQLGFDEIHYQDIMQPDDFEYKWGYDDCLFYKRAFEYLRKTYPNPEKLLVYIEVSMHHMGYNEKPEYSFVSRFNRTNQIEKYLDSYLAQDYCVDKFYEEFKKYAADNSHAFILPDHGAPLGLHGTVYANTRGAFNENFMVPLAYIPPAERRDEFSIGTKVDEFYSQTDFMPTIFELLNKQSYQNSFAFALQGRSKNNYEDCHVLTQYYNGGNIAVVKGKQKYIYSLDSRKLEHYDLVQDPYEQSPTVRYNISYGEFWEQYFCERFKN